MDLLLCECENEHQLECLACGRDGSGDRKTLNTLNLCECVGGTSNDVAFLKKHFSFSAIKRHSEKKDVV